jgi:hypothetical protein
MHVDGMILALLKLLSLLPRCPASFDMRAMYLTAEVDGTMNI